MSRNTVVPRGLRAQVTLSVAALVMLVVAVAGLIIALRIDHRDREDIDRQLLARTAKVRVDADKLLSDGAGVSSSGQPGDDDYGGLLAGSQSLVRLISGGAVVAERGEPLPGPIPMPTATGFSTIEVGGQPWRSLVRPVDERVQLQVLQSLESVQQRRADDGRIVAAVALLATVAAAFGVWLVAGLVLQPLQRLRIGARRIHHIDPDERLPAVERPQEVAELSATLNGMLERLRAGMLATRRFTADAGHELRTPLTSLGMDIEILHRNPDLPTAQRQDLLDAMTREHRRIVTLLDGLQTLARGDAGALPARTVVDTGELLDAAVPRARRRHPGVSYRLGEVSQGAPVEGWAAGLLLAVENLLDNAALHGRERGTVDVSLHRDGGTVRITVADDGPGIPSGERDAMRARFTRGERPRSDGSGLGLALVDQQATLHAGRLELGQAASGGLQATLILPVAPSDATKPLRDGQAGEGEQPGSAVS
jgi:two-component system sensor histidine kinase PrrB